MRTPKNPGYARIRRGLLEHLPSLPSNDLKVYLYVHLRARATGVDKGVFRATIRTICEDLGMRAEAVVSAIRRLETKQPKPFLQVDRARNRHGMTTYRILRFDPDASVPETETLEPTVSESETLDVPTVPDSVALPGTLGGTLDEPKQRAINGFDSSNKEKKEKKNTRRQGRDEKPFACDHAPRCSNRPWHICEVIRAAQDIPPLRPGEFHSKGELANAMRMLGSTPDEEIAGTVQLLRRDPFWQDKTITSATVSKNLGAYRRRQQSAGGESYGTPIRREEIEEENRKMAAAKAARLAGSSGER